MKAVVLRSFGSPDNLRIEEAEDPQTGVGEVRIDVEIAGLNMFDTHLRSGAIPDLYPLPELPTILGFEVAGTVDAVGAGVDSDWLGAPVVAHLGSARAGYAELAVAPLGSAHRLPPGLDPATAVTMLATGRTALVVLDFVNVGPQDVVLVTAAAGGVGGLILQELRHRGVFAVGAARGPAKLDWIRDQGAVAVDYGDPSWSERVRDLIGNRDVTVALDSVGGSIGRQALETVGQGGLVVLYGWASGEPTSVSAHDILSRGITICGAFGPRIAMRRPNGVRDFEQEALSAAASGRLSPKITELPMGEVVEAHRMLEARATIGKLVLVMPTAVPGPIRPGRVTVIDV